MFEAQQENQEARVTRKPRSTESRVFDTRKAEERAPLVYGSGSQFNVPEEIIKSDLDHKYCFVVRESMGEEQRENYYRSTRRGFFPVLASEHPSLSRNYDEGPFKKVSELDKYICCGGQILMKRRKEDHDAEEEMYNIQNMRERNIAETFKVGNQLKYEQR